MIANACVVTQNHAKYIRETIVNASLCLDNEME